MISPVLVLSIVSLLVSPFASAQDEPARVAAPPARFTTAQGTNLNGARFDLPGAFEAEFALVLMAFQMRHQIDVNTWLPFAAEMESRYADLRYYELPTMGEAKPEFQRFVDNGMRSGIPDLDVRARTICLYVKLPALLAGLEIEDTRNIRAMLVRRDGAVVWKATGRFDEAKGAALLKELESCARPRPAGLTDDLPKALAANGNFASLLTAARTAEILDAWSATGPLTILAPTDDAFAAVDPTQLRALLEPRKAERLERLLADHVIRGWFDAKSLEGRTRLRSSAGTAFDLRSEPEGLRIGDAVLGTPIPCRNGVVVPVDRVLTTLN